jgi:hypothetical protein
MILFRILFADQIFWDVGAFHECEPMLEEIEIPDGVELEWPE